MPPFIPSSHIAGTQICVSKIEEATFPSGELATLQFSYLPRSTMFSQITSRFRWKAVIKTESPKTKLHQLTFCWMYCEREWGVKSFDILDSPKIGPSLINLSQRDMHYNAYACSDIYISISRIIHISYFALQGDVSRQIRNKAKHFL